MGYVTYTFGIENKRFETNNKYYLIKLESFPFYNYSNYYYYYYLKSGFWATNLKKYKKKNPKIYKLYLFSLI